jgi:electron transfer flavoprotein alpha subunit
MSVLVLAEHDNQVLKSATLNAVTAAAELGDVTMLVAGKDCQGVAEAASKVAGITKVLHAESDAYADHLAENFAALLVELASDYSHVLAPATTSGKNIMPRVAALLDVAQISEISAIESADTFVRPIYAGNALATVKSSDAIKIITVRGTAFEAAQPEGGSATIEAISIDKDAGLSSFIGAELTQSERPELTSARIIISGGRGMQNGDNFKILEEVADKLGDAGFVTNDYQVGQTGKVVAPDLYIAVGISGAIQHLAGMKDSKVIVAINKDAEAPIFQIADYGVVDDLFNAIPELSAELDKALS